MKKIKVGIAGFGIVGKKRYSYLKNNRSFQVIGICEKEKINYPIDKKKIKVFIKSSLI